MHSLSCEASLSLFFSPQDSPSLLGLAGTPSSPKLSLLSALGQTPPALGPAGPARSRGGAELRGLCVSSVTAALAPARLPRLPHPSPSHGPQRTKGLCFPVTVSILVFPCSGDRTVPRLQHILTVVVAVMIPVVRHLYVTLVLGMLCFNMDENYPL